MMHNILQSIISYARFWWKSTNQHGVHSPFVFQLVTKCLYDKKKHPTYQTWKKFQKTLLNNHEIIMIHDFGAGSKIFTTNSRKIASIAKYAGMSYRKAKLLIRLTNYFKPNQILELGTSVGLGTFALYLGNSSAKITTIEGCEQTRLAALKNWKLHQKASDNPNFVLGNFNKVIPELKLDKLDLIFFDGNHSKKATLDYVDLLIPYISNKSIWVFDDIHWSKDMEEAWESIKLHPKVTVSIDLYYFGLVFFRQEQAKEHFVIRT